MFIFDISNILNLLLMLIATVLLIFLAQELKKSYIAGFVLFAYLIILIMHAAQLVTLPEEYRDMLPILGRCVAIDFVFIFISFFAYLWVVADNLRKGAASNAIQILENMINT